MADPENDNEFGDNEPGDREIGDKKFGEIEFGELRENPYRPQNSPLSMHTGFGQYGEPLPPSHSNQNSIQITRHASNAQLPVDPQMPTEPPPKTTASGIVVSFLCWGLFLAISTFIAISYHFYVPVEGEVSPRAELFELTFGAKLMVGAKSFDQSDSEVENSNADFDVSEFGSVRNLQAGSVLVAEMNSLEAAADSLDELESQADFEDYVFSEDEKRVNHTLRQIFDRVDLAEISQSDRDHLRQELHWFGKLALNLQRDETETPSAERSELLENARTKSIFLVVAILVGVLAFVGGLVGMIVFLVLYATQKLRIRTEHYTQHSSIYIEAAVGWILTYFASGLVLGMLAPNSNPLHMMIAVDVISFSFAVFWPVIRGVRFGTLMKDIGFVGNVVVEACLGFVSYIACLPILAIGYIISMIAISIAAPTIQEGTLSSPNNPGHPMVEWVAEGDLATIALVFIVACVGAPIVEETVFRGLMYRNLRDNTFRIGHFFSVTISALVNGIIFAAIHPQGIFLVPMLAALAISFSIVREWRGSLIAPMTMHAIHNALVTSLLLFILID